MIYTELTKKAMQIAFDAHFGQTDRGGTPYICHPLHLAGQMPDEARTVTALLHDVLEDTDMTAEDLISQGIPEPVVRSVEILTRDKTLPYANYIEGIISSKDCDAIFVKYLDVCHNLDESRTDTGQLPRYLLERYRIAKEMLYTALQNLYPGQ